VQLAGLQDRLRHERLQVGAGGLRYGCCTAKTYNFSLRPHGCCVAPAGHFP
jgi:hypothetical protein